MTHAYITLSSPNKLTVSVSPKIDHGPDGPPPKVHGVVIHGFAPIAEIICFTPFPLSHGLDRTPISIAFAKYCTKQLGDQGKNGDPELNICKFISYEIYHVYQNESLQAL